VADHLIGVTGSTGEVGGRVARRLAERGVPQRLIVRDPSRAPELTGTEVVTADSYSDVDSMRRALAGVHTLFFVSGREQKDRIAEHVSAIDSAVAAGVERVVYLSFLGAAPDATFTLARHHYATEQYIRGTGLVFTVTRSSMYLDSMTRYAGAAGLIRGPAGNGRVAAVSRDDIADVVVATLTTEGHDGAVYDMTGPESLTMAEFADRLTQLSGREVRYENETLEEAWASRSTYGAPDWEVEGWISSYLAVAAGELDVVSDTVLRLTGHEPQTLSEFVERHPESLERLRPPPR
jgi:NAD(P)H dehydrogenase (quinone)